MDLLLLILRNMRLYRIRRAYKKKYDVTALVELLVDLSKPVILRIEVADSKTEEVLNAISQYRVN